MKKVMCRCWLLFVLCFMYAPIIILTFYSFTKSSMIGALRGFSLQNYVTLMETEELKSMILGTVILALSVATISVILGTVGALGAHYSRGHIRYATEFFNRIPVINADVVTGFSVCILLIVFLRIPKDSFVPLVAGLCVLCTPFVYLSVMPRLKNMDPRLYEAALDLGATPRRALFSVVIPEIIPGMIGGFVTSITLAVDDYFITTYTKPAAFDTISTYVVNATKGAQTKIKTALWALSAVIFLLVVIAVLINYFYSMKHDGVEEDRIED